jgi:hypothetical protein
MKNFYHKSEMEGKGSSETTAKFYKKPPKLRKISTRNLKWRKKFFRNYDKFLRETSETMENFYQKPEMEGRDFSEMWVIF